MGAFFDSKPLKELLLLNEFFYYTPRFYLWHFGYYFILHLPSSLSAK